MPKGVITPEVPLDKDLLLGEGVYIADYGEVGETVVGATRGGGKIEIDKIIRSMPYDGSYGENKSLRRYERYVPRIIATILKNTYEVLNFAMPVTVTEETNYRDIDFRLNIEDTDYLTNIAFVGKKLGGQSCIIIIYNPLNDGNISFDFKEKDEVTTEMQYTAHYDRTTPTTPPIEVRDYDIVT